MLTGTYKKKFVAPLAPLLCFAFVTKYHTKTKKKGKTGTQVLIQFSASTFASFSSTDYYDSINNIEVYNPTSFVYFYVKQQKEQEENKIKRKL